MIIVQPCSKEYKPFDLGRKERYSRLACRSPPGECSFLGLDPSDLAKYTVYNCDRNEIGEVTDEREYCHRDPQEMSRHDPLIRRHLEAGELAFHYCFRPEGQPVTVTRLIHAANLRRPPRADRPPHRRRQQHSPGQRSPTSPDMVLLIIAKIARLPRPARPGPAGRVAHWLTWRAVVAGNSTCTGHSRQVVAWL